MQGPFLLILLPHIVVLKTGQWALKKDFLNGLGSYNTCTSVITDTCTVDSKNKNVNNSITAFVDDGACIFDISIFDISWRTFLANFLAFFLAYFLTYFLAYFLAYLSYFLSCLLSYVVSCLLSCLSFVLSSLLSHLLSCLLPAYLSYFLSCLLSYLLSCLLACFSF